MGQLQKKLEDKGEMMLLVGYHPTGGYKLFDVANNIIVISQYVMVVELRRLDSAKIGLTGPIIGY